MRGTHVEMDLAIDLKRYIIIYHNKIKRNGKTSQTQKCKEIGVKYVYKRMIKLKIFID